MKAAIAPAKEDVDAVVRQVRKSPHPDTRNLVGEVSCRRVERYPGSGKRTLVVVDCGVEGNINPEGPRYADVIRVPDDPTSDAILAHQPGGVILSHGPR